MSCSPDSMDGCAHPNHQFNMVLNAVMRQSRKHSVRVDGIAHDKWPFVRHWLRIVALIGKVNLQRRKHMTVQVVLVKEERKRLRSRTRQGWSYVCSPSRRCPRLVVVVVSATAICFHRLFSTHHLRSSVTLCLSKQWDALIQSLKKIQTANHRCR